MKRLFLLVIAVAVITPVLAQNSNNVALNNRVRLSYGDGYFMSVAIGFADALVGGIIFNEDFDYSTTGVITVGYRRVLNDGRWTLGGDASYLGITRKGAENISDKNYNMFAVMGGADFYYMKRGLVRLYSAADAGVIMTSSGAGFMFQFSPLAVRVGRERFAGFLEVGAGYKGIFNFGVELGF